MRTVVRNGALSSGHHLGIKMLTENALPPMFADLDDSRAGLDAMRAVFRERNPGYDLEYHRRLERLDAGDGPRIAFVQHGQTRGQVGKETSPIAIGDIVLVRPGCGFACDAPIGALVFDVPSPLPDELPAFLRVDWDPRISDTPGGCATQTGAYRRILLTWEGKNGPYLYHALNAHRVRMTNSFSHYHPPDGFDEFYLVQGVQENAKVLTSHRTRRVTHPELVTAEEVPDLLQENPLKVDQLAYFPRGTMHRGVDGVLAQVITVPGFMPGKEIGVDHHLRAINERLELEGDDALPYNIEASSGPVIK